MQNIQKECEHPLQEVYMMGYKFWHCGECDLLFTEEQVGKCDECGNIFQMYNKFCPVCYQNRNK